MSTSRPTEPGRKVPIHGVLSQPGRSLWVFVTLGTKNKLPWLAQSSVQDTLLDIWSQANSWLVGRYILMPDHLHFLCAYYQSGHPLEIWMSYWKRLFTIRNIPQTGRWQRSHWDVRMRDHLHAQQKWDYVRLNPVRAGLVERAEDWPYQGEAHPLIWND